MRLMLCIHHPLDHDTVAVLLLEQSVGFWLVLLEKANLIAYTCSGHADSLLSYKI